MTYNKNVYFQNKDEIFSNQVYPFFKNLNDDDDKNLNDIDKKYFREIKEYIEKNNTLPFSFNSQELLYLKKSKKEIWLEYFIFRYKFRKFPKEKIVSEFPIYVLIEPVSTCNIRCKMCFQIDKSFTRKPYMGIMDMNF